MPLAILVSSLDKGITLTLVLGAYGVGKTTFINYFRKHIEQGFVVGMVKGDLPSAQSLLQQTLISFGGKANKLGIDEMLRQLSDILSSQFKKQNQQPSLLIIDDADSMTFDALKGLELLLDLLNSENKQVLQVVLVGQYRLRHLLNTPELQGLSIGTQCPLGTLTAEETRSYIDHRLNAVGMVEHELFDEQAYLAIHEHSEGIPGKINSICDEALSRKRVQKKHQVSAALVHDVVNSNTQVEEPEATQALHVPPISAISGNPKERWLFGTVTSGLLAGVIWVALLVPDSFFLSLEWLQYEIPNGLTESPAGMKFVSDETLQDKISAQGVTENQFASTENHLQSLLLTSPKEPNNEVTYQGIKQIAEKLKALAERESHMGSPDKTSNYLQQTAVIPPEPEDIQPTLVQARKRGDTIETTKDKDEQQAVDASTEEKIANLLAVAERQLAAMKLILPTKDNAYETYAAVLAIVPNEQHALTGMQHIANRYLELARRYHTEGNLDKSQQFVSRGLIASPDHKELAKLKNQIDINLTLFHAKQEKIKALIQKAELQVAALELARPQDDNAYKTYQAVLAIDMGNPQATRGVQKIQHWFKSQIQNARDKKDFVTMRKAIFAAFETKVIIEAQLENLLSLAKQQFKARQWTQPAGDNAFESYHNILQVDPTNDAAKKGLSRLVKLYETMVRNAISDGKINQATVIVNEGLKAFPDNQTLRVLRDSSVVQRDAVFNSSL